MLSWYAKRRAFSDHHVRILMEWTLHSCMGRFKRYKNHISDVSYLSIGFKGKGEEGRVRKETDSNHTHLSHWIIHISVFSSVKILSIHNDDQVGRESHSPAELLCNDTRLAMCRSEYNLLHPSRRREENPAEVLEIPLGWGRKK